MKKSALLFGLILAFTVGFTVNFFISNSLNEELILAEVKQVSTVGEDIFVDYVSLDGDSQGSYIYNPEEHYVKSDYKRGDQVLVKNNVIQDYLRHKGLIWLLVIFILVVSFVAGWQGIMSLFGMFFSFLLIFYFLIPQLISGGDAFFSVLLVCFAVVVVNFVMAHGLGRKTLAAILGTFLALILAYVLVVVFQDLNHLTGLASEDELFLIGVADIDFAQLFLAGVIISVLGVLDDVTVAQVSIVQELKNANENLSRSELLKRSLVVGRDHIASVVNTIVLVYVGASLPLFMLFVVYKEPLLEVINLEFIAEEITKILTSSIALIMAVPLSAVIAVFLLKKGGKVSSCSHRH